MNETDSPLKRLVRTSAVDFAEWILKAEVDHIEAANIELHADPAPIFSDLLFWVTLVETDANGDPIRILLHFEFQGKSSHKPMPLRVLDYLVRITDSERNFRIHSTVFYIGDGVGAKDTGAHQLKGIGDRVTLAWRYDVVRLWQIEPEDLLNLKRPGLLPLIGQTKIENPDELIPRIYEQIKSVPNEETQHRLLTELLALLQDKEIVEMVETLIRQDDWVLDTPYIRRWRNEIQEAQSEAREAQSEAREAQRRLEHVQSQAEQAQSQVEQAQSQTEQLKSQTEQLKSQAEAYRIQAEQDRQENLRQTERIRREEAERGYETRRQDIVNLVAARYNPSLQEGLRLQRYLSTIVDNEKFRRIFEAVIHAQDFEQFYMIVEEAASGRSMDRVI